MAKHVLNKRTVYKPVEILKVFNLFSIYNAFAPSKGAVSAIINPMFRTR